jgi:hypothetical protein
MAGACACIGTALPVGMALSMRVQMIVAATIGNAGSEQHEQVSAVTGLPLWGLCVPSGEAAIARADAVPLSRP